jgi:glucose/arabinose dehydrogenase
MDDKSTRYSRRGVLAACGVTFLGGCVNLGDGDGDETGTLGGTDFDGDLAEDDYTHPTPPDDTDWEPAAGSPLDVDIEIEVLVENLEIPWDITFTGNDELFMTERTGDILRFDSAEVSKVASPQDAIDAGAVEPGTEERPWWVEGGEGGTLGIAAHPQYPEESYVYVYYTATEGDGKVNRVVRYDVKAADPAETEEILIDGIPAENYHNGGRITFGPDDNLWVCTGDAGARENARNLSSLAGKILRVSPEGEPLTTNPALDGDPRIFTYGHRNPQGIDWLPDGVPVVNEHGPTGLDELQALRPGGDYGWNVARGGPDNDTFDSYTEHDDFIPPVLNTGPGNSWAPTGATFYDGDAIPAWQNRHIVAGLISQSVFIVTLTPPGGDPPPTDHQDARLFDADWLDDAYTATSHRILRDELGRVRYVTQSPSGDLYAITSNRDGRANEDSPFPRERDDVLVRLKA